jgi:hypothetical protein
LTERLGQHLFVGIVEFQHDLIMRRKRSDGDIAPLTLGQALTAQVRLIVWCKACGHRAEPDIAAQGSRIAANDRPISSSEVHRCKAHAGAREL